MLNANNFWTWRNPQRWAELEKLLAREAPAVFNCLRPPASLDEIHAAEAEMGMVLPAEIRVAYLRHDGADRYWVEDDESALFPPYYNWLPLEQMLDTWRFFRDVSDWPSNLEMEQYYVDCADEFATTAMKGAESDKRIPIGRGWGKILFIDLDPLPGGTVGQLGVHAHGMGAELVAGSLSECLDGLMRKLLGDQPPSMAEIAEASDDEGASARAITDGLAAPVIVRQPEAATVDAGSSARLRVDAAGDGHLQYQWFRDGIGIPGAEAPEVHVAADAAGIGRSFRITVEVSNSAGVATSIPVALTVTHPIGGVSVEELVDAAAGARVEIRRRAALTVPPGALVSNAKVRMVAEQADRLGIASHFIPIGDAITLDTGGVGFSRALELEIAWSDSVAENKVLGLLELGPTVAGDGGNTETSTPAVRVLGLSARHGGYGSMVMGLDRPGRYLMAQVPESSITDEME